LNAQRNHVANASGPKRNCPQVRIRQISPEILHS